ncbi:hypothetical protein [Pseudomonas sp. NPDC096950]|uniref:hypothetical protein n=1 Tax=Pseudomonas sp. NPDC096950 TaxID=3364485 RepID=UPI00383A868C
MKCNTITVSTWHAATDLSNELFREADRLNDIAYDLLPNVANSPEDALAFQTARAAADAKTLEGKRSWDKARAELRSGN